MNDTPPPPDSRDVDEIFLSAWELPLPQRPNFLNKACQSNPGIRAEVEKLLAIADAKPNLMIPPEIGLVPQQLNRYEILEECGRGGMGIVFKARDTRLLRTVALKVLPRYLGNDDRNLDRFTREARILARLNHPNIATLYSLEESNDFHFLTMQFVDGETLAQIQSTRPLDNQQTIALARQVLLALEAAHDQGVCHCDLKPANIMLSPDGKVSVLDFGIARAFRNVLTEKQPYLLPGQAATISLGTPGYMSPEQSRGDPVGAEVDLWALGVILFECLTGKPFSWQSPIPIEGILGQFPKKAPSSLKGLVKECLVPDPARRLSSAKEARLRLEALAKPRVTPRNGLIALVVALVLSILLIVVWFDGRRPEGPLSHVDIPTSEVITGMNQAGEVLWTRPLGADVKTTRVLREYEGTPGGAGCIAILDPQGPSHVLLGLDPESGATPWQHQPGWTPPVNVMGPIRYRWSYEVDWPGREDSVLLCGIRDGLWYSFAVEAVDRFGNTLAVYHHPGPLRALPPEDSSGQPSEKVVLHGVNSSARFDRRLVTFETQHHPGCVIWLQLPDLDGQAFPWSMDLPEARDWPGMPPAKEKAYLTIPLISANLGAKVIELSVMSASSASGRYTAVVEDGRMVILDEDLFPLKVLLATDSPADSLFRNAGATMTPYLYFKDGKEHWIDVPLDL